VAKQDITVRELVDMVKRGELRLPELQRQFVWTATRVRDLLDSLYRGYPSGTILVWETQEDVPEKDLAIEQGPNTFSTKKLLLDGQQRLTSLAAVLGGKAVKVKNRSKPIDIAFNLDHPDAAPKDVTEVEEDALGALDAPVDAEDDSNVPTQSVLERSQNLAFVVATNALLADPHWIRVTEIFDDDKDDYQLLKRLDIPPGDPRYTRYSRRIQTVRNIRQYTYVMQILERNLPYEEVAEIFVRVNSLGVKLRSSDLAMAQITARWLNSLPLFEEFAEECEKVWFTLDLGLLVRMLVVFATHQSRFATVTRIPLTKLQSGWEQAKVGLRFAINFLRQNAGIEDESLLSSPFLMIPVAVFAVLHKQQITAEQERKLLYWLFIAHANGHYSGSAETTLDRDLNTLFRGGGPDELIEILRQEGARFSFEASEFVGRGERNPLFSLCYLALKRAGAKDWRSGVALSLSHSGSSHSIQVHHIFPRSVLKHAGYELAEINEIANFAFISSATNQAFSNKTPDIYLPAIVEARGLDALNGQRVPSDPHLWTVDRYPQFLADRRSLLAKTVNDFIELLSSAKQAIVDIEGLVATGESDLVEFKETARFNTHTSGVDREMEREVVRTVAAFLNSNGGSLVIGVNDAGIPTGIDRDLKTLSARPNTDGYEQFLRTLLGTAIGKDRSATVRVSFPDLDGKRLCLVGVPRAPQQVYVTDGPNRSFYVRSGNTTQALNMEEAHKYIHEHF
jgi:hypothetical protein